jgi:GH35 family endo-1,4-beta-xylanase
VLQLEGSATGTYLQDITIKSGINDALGRNLAVHDKSTKTIYKNTLLYGYQDTWTSNNNQGLYYFEGGQVRGRTDYPLLFDRSLKPKPCAAAVLRLAEEAPVK